MDDEIDYNFVFYEGVGSWHLQEPHTLSFQ